MDDQHQLIEPELNSFLKTQTIFQIFQTPAVIMQIWSSLKNPSNFGQFWSKQGNSHQNWPKNAKDARKELRENEERGFL